MAKEEEGDLREAAAKHLGVAERDVARLRIPDEELERIAEDEPFADEAALHDVVTGPFFEAMLARDQWLIAQPIDVVIQRADGAARFQIGDCIVLVDEVHDQHVDDSHSTIIWDVAHWLDEPVRLIARGKGRHLRLTFAVSPGLRVLAEFRGQRSGTATGSCQCRVVDECVVERHNALMHERSRQWVFGSPLDVAR